MTTTHEVSAATELDFDFAAEDEEFRTELRAMLADWLPDDWRGIFATPDAYEVAGAFCRELAERGWLTQAWPRQYGGQDASIWRQAVLQEELWAHNEPRGAQYMNVNWIAPAIRHFGTEQQKLEFLPRMASGEVIWAQGFSEPEAGSDLGSLRCRADRVEGGFLVNGQKIWTSYGDLAEYIFLIVRTDPESRGKRGLTVLLVDLKSPGITRREIPTNLGHHRQAEEFFDDVFVPESAVLGSINNGWAVTTKALSFERSGSARYARSARTLGVLEREYGDDWDAAANLRFAELLAFARATELMNYDVMVRKEADDLPRWRPSATRIHNALLEQYITAFAEDVASPAVVLTAGDHAPQNGEIEALARNAPTATITSGTKEIQLGIIWRDALGGVPAR